ncbi:MAG: hypothetical protein O3A95_05550 [Planctomycetota bacterium]|nr:hypothetical protein [Planctomycetota bacterium]MDA1113751.1 hypothetical protein [Planctomycetota bacterium]
MRSLPALIAIVLLLLPSSLGAVVAAQETCAKMAAMAEMSCCCEHQAEAPADLGPSISRTCCCAYDLPVAPAPLQEGVRMHKEGKSDTSLFESHFAVFSFPNLPLLTSVQQAAPGPPRAPPRPLYLSFQSFLI